MENHQHRVDIPFHFKGNPPDEQRCIDLLRAALENEPGLYGLTLDMPAARLSLRYDPDLISLSHIQGVAKQLGIVLGKRYKTCLWRIEGVRCADCSLRVAEDLKQVPGVAHVAVNPAAEAIGVEYDATTANVRTFEERLAQAGYAVHPQPRTRAELHAIHAEEAAARRRMAVLTTLSLLALLTAWFAEKLNLIATPLVLAIYAVSYIAGGYYSTQRALRELRARSINVDLLMIVAGLGAAAVGELPEGAILLFLFSLSNTLERYVLGYTRRAIEALMDLAPKEAVVRRDGEERRVPIDELRPGDTIIVRPGERIAADGIVLTGHTSIDQSAMTGESIPVEKVVGDYVYAATLNQQGAIEVRVVHVAGETALARIVQLVEQARSERAQSQRFADWFGQRYTIAVLSAAALALILPTIFMREPFAITFYRAMTILVVASPCAVVISIPATILAGITSAARAGVLFKGGAHLERAARIRAIAFDKTGTLTIGQPQLVDLRVAHDVTPDQVLQLAASAEALSEHPLANAVVEAARAQGLTLRAASHLEALIGHGIRAQVDGQWILMGRAKLFMERGVRIPSNLASAAFDLQSAGRTVVFIGDESRVLGLLAIADTLRASAADAVRELRTLGIEHLVMLTGDNRTVAQSIAQHLGLEYTAELMPEEKLRVIHNLRDEYERVAMVGDGINDAPSLASSDLGISLGVKGTDVALETADLVLMSDDLRHLPYAIKLARQASRIIRQNLVFAFGMMTLLLVITLFGSLRLPIAVVGHEGSTVLVILNGLRLLAFPRPTSAAQEKRPGTIRTDDTSAGAMEIR